MKTTHRIARLVLFFGCASFTPVAGHTADTNQQEAISQAAEFSRIKALAEKGNAEAEGYLGSFFAKGKGVQKDLVEAVRWYRKAALHGDAKAQCALGKCFDDGEGVARNPEEAAKWYYQAAKQGLAIAQYNLSLSYAKGEGVPKSASEAAKWLRAAADQGLEAAQVEQQQTLKAEQQEQAAQRSRELSRLATEQPVTRQAAQTTSKNGFEDLGAVAEQPAPAEKTAESAQSAGSSTRALQPIPDSEGTGHTTHPVNYPSKRESDASLWIGLSIMAFPFLAAALLGRRHRRLRPQCHSFWWGYFVGICGFLIPFFIPSGDLQVTALLLVLYAPISILTLLRNRWGLLFATVLSLNPIVMLINCFYIPKRWKELRWGGGTAAEGGVPVGHAVTTRESPSVLQKVAENFLSEMDHAAAARESPSVRPQGLEKSPISYIWFVCDECGAENCATAFFAGTRKPCCHCGFEMVVPRRSDPPSSQGNLPKVPSQYSATPPPQQVSAATARVDAVPADQPPVSLMQSKPSTRMERLAELQKLLETAHITPDEFAEHRARILKDI